jgi:glycerol-3-phosphate acyltransferase PlsX
MKIGLDAMGGDFAPQACLAGAIEATKELGEEDSIVLFGKKSLIVSELEKLGSVADAFEIIDAPETIEMGDSPMKAFSQKPYSSMALGFKLLRAKNIQAFASAGNTGAMLVGSMMVINNIKGVIRPSISTFVPQENGSRAIMLDVGANPDCKADVLYQFGLLGSVYSKTVLRVKKPRVALLNIGHEEKKGNILFQSVHQMMKGSNDFHFIGNIEGGDLFANKADVIVTDGFNGNIVLKLVESMYKILAKKGIHDPLVDRFNYEEIGGTPVLGVNAPVVIGHGISNAKAVKSMIMLAKAEYDQNLVKSIKRALSRYYMNIK